MRAAKNEIFGSATAENRPSSSASRPDTSKDLTSSRLQSELYCESHQRRAGLMAVSAAYQALRLCSFLSNPTMYTIQAQARQPLYPAGMS